MTTGKTTVYAIEVFGDSNPVELLRLAASLDQVSRHEFAPTLVRAAHDRDLVLSIPSDVIEEVLYGIRGRVDGRCIALGTSYWVDRTSGALERVRGVQREAARSGCSNVFVAIDGVLAGAILIGTSGAPKPLWEWPDEVWCLYA